MVLKLRCTSVSPYELFENDVKMYGTQTLKELTNKNSKFENDVKMYGTQTSDPISLTSPSLRMM